MMKSPTPSHTSPTPSEASTRTPPSVHDGSSTRSSFGSLSSQSSIDNDLTLPLFINKKVDYARILFAKTQRPYYEVFFVVVPMYAGYASLFGLQHELKRNLGLLDDNSFLSHFFGFATSFLFLTNFGFRACHWYVFRISPYHRTIFAIASMICSMCIVASIYLVSATSLQVYGLDVRIFLAYILGGMAIGTFENNMLASVTPLGAATKRWAIIGIPTGIAGVQIGAFVFLSVIPVVCVHVAIAASLFCVLPIWVRLPIPQHDEDSFRNFSRAIGDWRRWLVPHMWSRPIPYCIDMLLLVSIAPGALLFIYNQKHVNLQLGQMTVQVRTEIFFAVFNGSCLLGGLVGRWFSYYMKARHTAWFLPLSALGAVLILLKQPEIAPLGAFLIYCGDGCMYSQLCRFIDTQLPSKYTQASMSYWFLIGDAGSAIGSSLVPFIRDWLAAAV